MQEQGLKLTKDEPREVEPRGLEDGGHVIVRCSNCNAGLLDIWRTLPHAVNPRTGKVFQWKVRANCPFCGDRSFVTEVEGVFHVGGYGEVKHDNEDDDIPSTVIQGTDVNDRTGTYDFTLVKASHVAKPIRY